MIHLHPKKQKKKELSKNFIDCLLQLENKKKKKKK